MDFTAWGIASATKPPLKAEEVASQLNPVLKKSASAKTNRSGSPSCEIERREHRLRNYSSGDADLRSHGRDCQSGPGIYPGSVGERVCDPIRSSRQPRRNGRA